MTNESLYAAPAAKVGDSVPDAPGEIFNNNHLRLMKYHIGLAIFYGCLFGFLGFLTAENNQTVTTASFALIIGFFSLPALIHLLLSYGSYRRIELSRKASEIVFVLLFLAFPIGTLLSMYLFLPATVWKASDDKKP